MPGVDGRAMRFTTLTTWAAALSLASLLPGGAAASGCELSLWASPGSSSFKLAGEVVEPVSMTLEPAHPEAKVGLQGRVVLGLVGACPVDAAALEAALPDAVFKTAADSPLLLYPSEGYTIEAGSLVSLEFSQAALALSSGPVRQGVGGAGLSTAVGLAPAGGVVLSTSLLSPAPETIDWTNGSTSATSAPSAVDVASKGGRAVEVRLAGVSVNVTSVYNSVLAGQPLRGVTNYTLDGDLTLEVVLGCTADCGPHGRCGQAGGGANASAPAEVGCVCECGWSGAACSVASGFCPLYAADINQTAAVAECPAPPAPAPAPSNATLQPCMQRVCGEREEADPATGACRCKAGWSGPNCDACASAAACDAFFGATGSVCSAARPYTEQSQLKAYSCGLEGTGLEDVIAPGTFFVTCNTSSASQASQEGGSGQGGVAAAALDGLSTPHCIVSFAMATEVDNLVSCVSAECNFRANSTLVTCATTTCSCERDCPEVQGVLDSIDGNPSTVDCSPEGECVFDIDNFFVKLVAPCTNAECLVPGYLMSEGNYLFQPQRSYDAVIAAVPLLAVVAVAALLTAYVAMNHALFASGAGAAGAAAGVAGAGAGGTASGAAGAGGAKGGGGGGQQRGAVQQLRWEGLTCAVAVRRDWWGREGVLARALRRPWRLGRTMHSSAGSGRGANGDTRLILADVSGDAALGELVGILGPSGSGKTTLLGSLAGSGEDSASWTYASGAVLMGAGSLGGGGGGGGASVAAYVPQEDTLLPTLTVEECVRYSALLRLPAGTATGEVSARVWATLRELGLEGVAASRVGGGSGIRGISGGERRRVTIGMELVIDPGVLLLDEPTSGLDSFSALNLMRTLRAVAGVGRIVVLSFHQPSPAMFSLLDRAYLMAAGRCIFAGPPAGAEAWFEAQGLPCPAGTAIAEHMLMVVSDSAALAALTAPPGSGGGGGTADVDSEKGGLASLQDRTSSETAQAAAADEAGAKGGSGSWEGGVVVGVPSAASPSRQRRRRQGAGVGREVAVLFWRTLLDIGRNPMLLLLHWGLALAMGLFTGAIFYQVGLDIKGAQNRAGGLFFVLAFFAFTSLTTVDLLLAERRMVAREVRGGYYAPGTYLLAKATLDGLLLRVLPVFLYAAPFYPMMGLASGSSHVAVFLFVTATFALAVGALSLAVTVGSSTAGQASLAMNLILLMSLLVGGFFVNVDSIPAWISWLHYLSPFYYAYTSLISNEVAGLLLDFVVEGYAAVQNVRGVTFLSLIGIQASDLTRNIIILDCFYAALLALAFALLYLRMPRPHGGLRRRRAGPSGATGAPVASSGDLPL